MILRRQWTFAQCLGAFLSLTAVTAQAQDERTAIEVQRLLRENCLGCHGETQQLAGLDLRTREAMLKGGSRGPALVPGDPASSLLIDALKGNRNIPMPPGKPLAAGSIALFESWVSAGAPSPAAEEKPRWIYKHEDLWAFQPLKRPQVPPASAVHTIDAFLNRKLEEKGLTRAPPAGKLTLLRRATFDLTGLPPTPDEVDAFLADRSPEAFGKVVERLLASPRYGERWGRHWLDVVRYADSDGFSNDYERPNAWRYRDYVIRSFNNDKPYNRFVLEQIAGDEIGPADSENLIAAGFLRMGPWEHTGMAVAEVTRQAFLDDVTHSTATAFLGLTMGCAKCHDHKFDPIPTKDYYRLQAVFATTWFEQRPAPFLEYENQSRFADDRERLAELIRRTELHLEGLRDVVRERMVKKLGVESVDQIPKDVLEKALRTFETITNAEFEPLKVYRKRLELYAREKQRHEPLAFSVSSGLKDEKPVPETFILVGGALGSNGERVRPGLVSAAYRYVPTVERGIPEAPEGRRTALARWIADPANPLTARVMVNRIWQYHFGKGIAANPNNFGKMGQKPSHPELLDWLASEFIERGWSVKQMHRLIMSSEAYQRSSEHPNSAHSSKVDPDNQLLAYFTPRRLEAEELRDSVLAVSGELSLDAGGPGTFPEINEDVANQPRLIMGTIAPVYQPSPKRRDRNRRTIYTFQKRSVADPVIEAFNGASMNESCERREATIVPAQVFTLLNSKFSRDMALAFADRLHREASGRPARVNRAFQLAFGRLPSDSERTQALAFVARSLALHARTAPPPLPTRKPVVRTMITEQTGEPFDIAEESEPVPYEENLHPSEVEPEVRALADLALALLNSNEFAYVY